MVLFHFVFERLNVELQLGLLGVAVQFGDFVKMRIGVVVDEFQVRRIGTTSLKKISIHFCSYFCVFGRLTSESCLCLRIMSLIFARPRLPFPFGSILDQIALF